MLAVLPAGAPAAEPLPVSEVSLYLQATRHGHEHLFELTVHPLEGLATIETVVADAKIIERTRAVDYAFAIPAGPFDGSLDVTVPGLGKVLGTVSTTREAGAVPKGCGQGAAEPESATFKGRIDFRGAGGYESWRANRARAGVSRYCTSHNAEPAPRDEFFSAIVQSGPQLPGPDTFYFVSHSRDRSREFVAFGGEGAIAFAAVDREWLPGDVATERWVSWWGVHFGKAVKVGPGGDHPTTVTFRPPWPLFGSAHYSRRTHTLSGSLGARFLGLNLRLTRPRLAALLDDEERH